MRHIEFIPGEYYHIYNRGVEKRDIFLCQTDFDRFYESLYLFNDRNYDRKGGSLIERGVQITTAEVFPDERDCFVSIVAHKLMNNHFHLKVREEQKGGISQFMHRVSTGYTNYFNLRYDRVGGLFQGPFEAIHVEKEGHFQHLVRYLHLNELDKYGISWREGEVQDWNHCLSLLDQDSYSSHGFYCGRGQKLPVVNEELATKLFPDPEEYLRFLQSWSERNMFDLPSGSAEFGA